MTLTVIILAFIIEFTNFRIQAGGHEMKKMIVLLLITICAVGMLSGCGEKDTAIQPAETAKTAAAGNSTVTVNLTDKTGYMEEDIDVVFVDTENGGEYAKTITSLEYLHQIGVKNVLPKGKTYSVRFDYVSAKKGLFAITNSDGTAISPFTADADKITFDWVITSVLDAPKTETDTQQNVGEEIIEEANAVLQHFLDVAAKYEDNAYFEQSLGIYNNDIHAHYCEENTEITAEEYLGKSAFERFIIYSTYVKPRMVLSNGHWSSYFETNGLFRSQVFSTETSWLKRIDKNNTELLDAFQEIIDFQYDYICSTGKVFYFYDNYEQ